MRGSKAVPGQLGLFLSSHSDPIPQGHTIAVYPGPALTVGSEGASAGQALLNLPPFLLQNSQAKASSRRLGATEQAWALNTAMSPEDLGLEGLLSFLQDAASVTLPTTRQLSGSEEDEGEAGLPRVPGGVGVLRRVLRGYEDTSAASANVGLHSSPFPSHGARDEVEGGLPPVMLLDDEAAWHLKATKDLGPGTELFLTYGAHFWLSKIIHNATTSPLVRLLVYLYLLDAQTQADSGGNEDELHSFPLLAHIYLDDNGTPILAPHGHGHSAPPPDKACTTFMRDVLGLGTKEEDRPQAIDSTSKGRKNRRMTAGASPSGRLQELVQQVLSSE